MVFDLANAFIRFAISCELYVRITSCFVHLYKITEMGDFVLMITKCRDIMQIYLGKTANNGKVEVNKKPASRSEPEKHLSRLPPKRPCRTAGRFLILILSAFLLLVNHGLARNREFYTVYSEVISMKKNEVTSLSDPCCNSCAYFMRHFVFQWENGIHYLPCSCGHCVRSRLRRNLSPYAAPCEKYKPRLPPGPIRFRLIRRVSRQGLQPPEEQEKKE